MSLQIELRSGITICLCLLLWLGLSTVISAAPNDESSKSWPDDLPTCSQNDLTLNDCLKAAFQQMIPRIKDGIKELNFPPMDPFVLEKATYQYTTGAVQGSVTMRKVHVYGMSSSTVEKVDMKLKDGKMFLEIVTHMPSVLVEGGYKADMKINELKMTPKGYFNVSMTDVKMISKPEGELYEKDGHTYLRITKFPSDPEIGDMRIYASNLLPDPTLNAVVLDFVNQYWRPIYKQMLPETRTTWEPLMIAIANEFLETFPIDTVLKKD